MNVKATLRLPTEQFGYIEVEMSGEPDDIIRKWFDLKEKYEARKNETLKEEEPAF